MDAFYPLAVAGMIAGILTYCDLDTVFDAPPQNLKWGPWLKLLAWWWGFLAINAVLAGILLVLLNEKKLLNDWNPWIAAVLAGASYTALVRLKFTTLSVNGKDTPIGFETLYEALKGLVHRRINRIIRAWRVEQSAILAETALATLRQRALLMVGSDSLMNAEQRNSNKTWIEQTVNDGGTSEHDKRLSLALFIITEQRSSQS